jgi:16S rRNA (cytosine1402-N4)-methyltransferase
MQMHLPVLLNESLKYLGISDERLKGGLQEEMVIVDATLGLGGHTEAILSASPRIRVIGFDRDKEAMELTRDRLQSFGERFVALHTDYRDIRQALAGYAMESVDGILADLGISSYQLDTPERGFSFRAESEFSNAPLDMRMDRSQAVTAAMLVNELSERELADIIFEYGEESAARRIARQIVATRVKHPITTSGQLAALVVRVVHPPGRWRTHPATKTFQALRIAVNRELENLDGFVADAVTLLKPGGRLVIITFHSLEDRLIKRSLKFQSGQCQCPPQLPDCQCGAQPLIEILTRKAVEPTAEEIKFNPRARSARLRACQKL